MLIGVCLAFSRGEPTHKQLKMMSHNPLEGVITGFSPTQVHPFETFTLTLSVNEVWNRAFYFKFDDGNPIEGFLDAENRPSVVIEGLPAGEKFLHVSWDKDQWAFVGTLKVVDSESEWVIVFVFFLSIVTYFVAQFLRGICLRRNRKKRSDDGLLSPSLV